MFNTITRRTLVSLVALAMVLGPIDAFAGKKKRTKKKAAATKVAAPERPAAPVEPPKPPPPVTEMDDATMLAAETIAVQPVFMVGADADAAWGHIATQIRLRKPAMDAAKSVAGHGIVAPEKTESGFGFAGASSQTDIKILHYAIALGFTTALTRIGQKDDAKKIAEGLTKSAGILATLTPDAQKSAKALIALAMGTGKADPGTVLADVVKAGMKGIATGPERAHGYYLTGVWAGSSVLISLLGGSQVWADMGEPIAILLDKDAAFGGSDRTLAKQVRAIAKQLASKKPDVKAITSTLKAMRTVTADAPRSAEKPASAAPAAAKEAEKAAPSK